VIKELASGRYDLLHYCGHVDVPSDPRFVGLRLHDNQLLDGRALAPLAEFGAPPIVFINGCASAARITNLCVSFMVMGAKAVVGTRYEVAERRARRFAERFYVEFLSGSSAGAAIRAARTALWQPPAGVDWAAFVLYGDPSVRISTTEAPPPPPPPPGHALDPEAKRLMDKVAEQAAPRGVATSMDLLIHLLSTQDIQARATDQDAAVHLALAGEVLRAVLDTLSTAPGSATGPVEYSDTVKSVLDRAGQLAHEAGRELISVNDLVTAFTAVGGGSSRQMLDLFGISLDKLAGVSPAAGGSDTERRKPSPAQESVVQKVPLPESNGHPRAGVLLDESGCLRVERLQPTVVTAVRAAAFLASGQRSQISTSMLLCGLAVADSARLREALHEQGAVGVAALRQLTLSAATHGKHFSSRTLRALERAAGGAEPVDDEALLREILSEPDSSARILLQRLGVDADRLRGDGSRTPHAADA
jgi:CHAT domain/Clp amino terminal domain, pathogenicity island component